MSWAGGGDRGGAFPEKAEVGCVGSRRLCEWISIICSYRAVFLERFQLGPYWRGGQVKGEKKGSDVK